MEQCSRLYGDVEPEFGETGNDLDRSLPVFGLRPSSPSLTCRSLRCRVSRRLENRDPPELRGESEGEEDAEDGDEKTFL